MSCAATLQRLHLENTELTASNGDHIEFGLDNFSKLKALSLRNCRIDVYSLLPPSLESLVLLRNIFDDHSIRHWTNSKLEKLRHLTLLVDDNGCAVEEFTELLNNADLTDSRELTINLTFEDCEDPEQVLEVLEFVSQHQNRITHLTAPDPQWMNYDAGMNERMVKGCVNLERIVLSFGSDCYLNEVRGIVDVLPNSVKAMILCQTSMVEMDIGCKKRCRTAVRELAESSRRKGTRLQVCSTGHTWSEHSDAAGCYDCVDIDEKIAMMDQFDDRDGECVVCSQFSSYWAGIE